MKKLSAGKIIIRYTLLAAVCAVIFWFSSNNGEDSTYQSSRIVDLICRIFFPDINLLEPARAMAIQDMLTVLVRKAAHFSIYTLLGALAFAAFFPVRYKSLRFLFSISFVFLYACTDEFHQTFISDRTGKFSDVIIDLCGGTLGAFIILAAVMLLEAHRIIKENKLRQTKTSEGQN